MKGYPAIVGKITAWTFDMARAAAWDQDIEGCYNASKAKIAEHAEYMAAENKKGTYATTVTGSQTVSENNDRMPQKQTQLYIYIHKIPY